MHDSSTFAYDAPSSILDSDGNTLAKVGSNTTGFTWDLKTGLYHYPAI